MLQNVSTVLEALKRRGLQLRHHHIESKDIVDGHREKTLCLLDLIRAHFQLPELFEPAAVQHEIAKLQKELVARGGDASQVPTQTATNKDSLLLQWCGAVCRLYGVDVRDFATGFSDGRALCFLVSYYYPALLPASRIRAASPRVAAAKAAPVLAPTSLFASPVVSRVAVPGDAFRNEKENFGMLQDALSDLGGVLFSLKQEDMCSGAFDVNELKTFVTFLCSRLLELSPQIRVRIWNTPNVITNY